MKKAFAVFIAAVMVLSCAGCSDKPYVSVSDTAESTSESMQTESTESISAEIQTIESADIAAESSEQTTETAETAEVTPPVSEEQTKPVTYSAPEEGHMFVDFEYIADVQGVPENELHPYVCENAVYELKKQEQYISACKDVLTLEGVDISGYLDENGAIAPKLYQAVLGDFNGDGGDDYFVLLTSPCESSFADKVSELYWLLWVSDNGVAYYLDVFRDSVTEVSVLDYGICQQLIVCNNGTIGAGCASGIYGIRDGKAVCHYRFRGGFTKVDCFINASGWQGSGDFMYYDTVAEEYRAILGRDMTIDEAFAMDTANSLDESKREFNKVVVIGEKYYLFVLSPMHTGDPYTYENGAFTYCGEDIPIRVSNGYQTNCVEDINYDEAATSMLSPEEALKQKQAEHLPSEGHIFVDFSYITDYKGTTDITECGKWYSMALNFLKIGKDYLHFNELLKNEDLANVKYYETAFAPNITDYLDENGNIQPILSGAYIDDYDRNGQDECFLLLDIPYYEETADYWITRSYLYYGNGKGIKYLNDFSNIWEISMLDYGLCRQFIIRAYGTMGADEAALIYGVVDGDVVKHYSFRGGFTKVDCFINASGWMGFGDFMYYDTVRQQYRAVASEHIPTPTILEMDSTGAFSAYYDDYENDPASLPWFMLVGGKYYCLWLGSSDMGTPYLYENGCFVPSEDKVRVSMGLSDIELNYDAAVSSMLSPAEAAYCT